MEKHVLIIGSGLGGLACGYILAKNGFRVSLFEKNVQPGGCLQTFVRRGVKFETGMHYLGSMDEGQTLHRFFKYLSLLSDVEIAPLDKSAYDIISLGGRRFDFANGTERFIDSLAAHFPKERHHLQHYCGVIRSVANDSPLYSLRHTDSVTLLNPEYIKQSASSFIDSVTDDALLRQALAGNLPLYAGIRGKTPLYIHALINDFYNRSSYRIVGGSDAVAHSLVKSIRAMGGAVYPSSKVVKINCDETKAVGITLESGGEVRGGYVISNIHPCRTIELLDTRLIRKPYRERIMNLRNTVSNFTVYISFRKEAMPYLNSNFFHYRDGVWGCETYTESDWPKSFLYMHLCASRNQRYATGAVLFAYMNFDDVAQWHGTRVGHRGEGYEAFKQAKAERLLDELERQMPGTRAKIGSYCTSTPLTYLDYTGTERGSMYGIFRDCTEPVRSIVSQRTKIPNLFQTGQNINSHGVLGVIIGAIIASGELLGINTIIDQIGKEAGCGD
ncbi:MAG: NAD(P)/FAD-dependent oxidoreductase [Tannerella sp.]|jgi:all-trans-retinol 13,14-reductase|nr:NAD(P)/FAD-dependent oxidoreductase [Tannerella sp.]